jgi:hypothetical protein
MLHHQRIASGNMLAHDNVLHSKRVDTTVSNGEDFCPLLYSMQELSAALSKK